MTKDEVRKATSKLFKQAMEYKKDGDKVDSVIFGFRSNGPGIILELPENKNLWPVIMRMIASKADGIFLITEAYSLEGSKDKPLPENLEGKDFKDVPGAEDTILGLFYMPGLEIMLRSVVKDGKPGRPKRLELSDPSKAGLEGMLANPYLQSEVNGKPLLIQHKEGLC